MKRIFLCPKHFTGVYNQIEDEDKTKCKFCIQENMKTPKNKLIDLIQECLDYCNEQNGMPYCKNCGLNKEALELLNEIVDWKEVAEDDKKKFI